MANGQGEWSFKYRWPTLAALDVHGVLSYLANDDERIRILLLPEGQYLAIEAKISREIIQWRAEQIRLRNKPPAPPRAHRAAGAS